MKKFLFLIIISVFLVVSRSDSSYDNFKTSNLNPTQPSQFQIEKLKEQETRKIGRNYNEEDEEDSLKKQLSEARKEIKEWKKKAFKYVEQLKSAQKKLSQYKNESEECKENSEKNLEELKKVRAELKDAKEELNKCNYRLEGYQLSCKEITNDLKAELKTCNSDLEKSNKKIDDTKAECQSKIDKLNQDLNSCKTESSNCDSSLTKCQEDKSALQTDLETCRLNSGDCEKKIEQIKGEFNSRINELEETILTCNKEKSDCTTDLSTCSSEKQTCETNLIIVTQSYDDCSGKLAQVSGKLETINAELSDIREKLSTASSELIVCQSNIGECTTALSACKENSASLEIQKEALEIQLTSLNEELDKCKGSLSECGESSAGCILELKSCKSENDKNKNTIETLNAGIEECEKAKTALTNRITLILIELEDLKKTCQVESQCESELKSCQDDKASLQEQVSGLGITITSLENEKTVLVEKEKACQDQIIIVNILLESLGAQIDKCTENYGECMSENFQLSGKLEGTTQQIKYLQVQIQECSIAHSTCQAQLTNVKQSSDFVLCILSSGNLPDAIEICSNINEKKQENNSTISQDLSTNRTEELPNINSIQTLPLNLTLNSPIQEEANNNTIEDLGTNTTIQKQPSLNITTQEIAKTLN